MNLTLHNPACRAVRARQRRCYRALRKAGKSWDCGYQPPEGTGVDRIWRKYGWIPSNRVVVTHVEVRNAA